MIYTLILTAFFSAYPSGAGYKTTVHVQHDYPTEEACHAAYKIAADQLKQEAQSILGTCLKVK